MYPSVPKCVVFLNKHAGALKITPGESAIEEAMKRVGLEAEVVMPESAQDMSQKIAGFVKGGTEKIIVSGGDGTVRLAAQQLVHTDCVLGIIPMGTSNNFATALRLPVQLDAALRAAKDGVVTEVSLGKMGDRYFIEGAGVGFFADALALYGVGSNKNLFRAVAAVGRLLLDMPRYRLKITLDGKSIVERAALCTVANIFRIAQGVPIAPDASLTDDVLDVTIVGDIRRREIPTYFRAIKAQQHATLPKIRQEKARTITIEALSGLNVHCDDRIIGSTPVTFTIEPRALKVLTPRL